MGRCASINSKQRHHFKLAKCSLLLFQLILRIGGIVELEKYSSLVALAECKRSVSCPNLIIGNEEVFSTNTACYELRIKKVVSTQQNDHCLDTGTATKSYRTAINRIYHGNQKPIEIRFLIANQAYQLRQKKVFQIVLFARK